ncbi:Dual specificity catalytic domain [Cordyceps militaris]|uniref:protein-tyrosine-phosphatase n=1 Tax=Cordyceps militaris TaxID=73501 RepID=A0A2H4S774_CORMI|nr:Dual specificity catalytic domain [Cordyceps militaris]
MTATTEGGAQLTRFCVPTHTSECRHEQTHRVYTVPSPCHDLVLNKSFGSDRPTPCTSPSAPKFDTTCPASISEIRPRLYIGNVFASVRPAVLRDNHITAIMSIINARYGQWSTPCIRNMVPEVNHLYIPCLDSTTMDLLPFLGRVCDFIKKHAQGPAGDNVLVHCHVGISRSASMVIAYLMREEKRSLDDVLAEVKSKRKVRPSSNFMEQLRVWDAVGYQIWQDSKETIPKVEYQAYLDRRAVRLQSLGLTGDEPIELQSL